MEPPLRHLTVDQILPIVGEFGKFQIVLDAMVFLMFLPVAFHPIIAYFSALTPAWACTHIMNATTCTFNGTFDADDANHDRCSMPRGEWEYLETKDFSLVRFWVSQETEIVPWINCSDPPSVEVPEPYQVVFRTLAVL